MDIQHIGDRVELDRINLHFSLGKNAAGDTYSNFRLIMFQWKNNTVPGVNDILNTGPSGVVDFLSDYNHDTKQLYVRMYDKTHTLVPTAETMTKYFNINKKIPRKYAQFYNASTVGTNHIYTLCVADVINPLNAVKFAYHSRIYYRDA